MRRAGAEVAGAETVVADLADPAAVAAVLDVAAGNAHAPLRAVVTAAGGFAGGPSRRRRSRSSRRSSALNLRTAYLDDPGRAPPSRRRRAAGRSSASGRGRGSTRSRGAAGYVASKAALHALADVVAREHRDDGIRCNVVVPGTIDTPANREAGMTGGVPPAAIARVIRFLCSEEAAATSGAIVPVYPP